MKYRLDFAGRQFGPVFPAKFRCAEAGFFRFDGRPGTTTR
jgi:hypothetical protein